MSSPVPPPRRDHLWKPGQSGNPKGRAPGQTERIRVIQEVKSLCRQNSEAAVAALIDVMNNKTAPPAARVTAANSILDRAFGRPTAVVEAKISTYDNMSEHELIEFIAGQTIDAEAIRIEETTEDGTEK